MYVYTGESVNPPYFLIKTSDVINTYRERERDTHTQTDFAESSNLCWLNPLKPPSPGRKERAARSRRRFGDGVPTPLPRARGGLAGKSEENHGKIWGNPIKMWV